MLKNFNDLLSIIFQVFILLWFGLCFLAVRFLGLDTVEGFGLGTATGVLLSILKDVYQFYFRKAPPVK